MNRLLVLFIAGVGAVLAEGPDFSVVEKVLLPQTYPKRLVAGTFTKGVFTVPAYGSAEKADASDPPFYPSLECGEQNLNLTSGSFGFITSPNYPDNYPPGLQCEWIIEGIPGTVVEATFFDVVTQPWLFAFSDYVLVSTSGNFSEYRRFAGDVNQKMPFTFISDENRLAIRFVSSKWLNFRGFKMSYLVRTMKDSDVSPSLNEFGSAYNNDLVAVCTSKPSGISRMNDKYHYKLPNEFEVLERMERSLRIVNGVETLPHQYPFMVVILTNNAGFCGGSLIDSNHVLTAAHCLFPDYDNIELEQVDLVFGVYNLSNRAENLYSRQVRSIQYPDIGSKVFIHPHYDPRSGANDIAIVRVNKLKITKYVQPVFLPSVYTESNSFNGWTLKTLGWGSVDGDKTKAKLTPILREASATVIPTVQCREEFSGSVTGNHICTLNPYRKPEQPSNSTTSSSTEVIGETTPETLKKVVKDDSDSDSSSTTYESPCHGDSGAPLIADFIENYPENGEYPNKAGPSVHECVNAKQNGVVNEMNNTLTTQNNACERPKDAYESWYVQVGVLSFGSKVCGRDIPVVYTRLTAYLQWIAYITGRHG